MNERRTLKSAAGLILRFGVISTVTGCASVVSVSEYPVLISSTPSEAVVSVKDMCGKELSKQATPGKLTLKASAGYFKRARYDFHFEKDGYIPKDVSLSAHLDPWWYGNLPFLGLGAIGALIIDPVTGTMWKLHDAVHVVLLPTPSHEGDGASSLSVADQLKELKKLKDEGLLTQEEYQAKADELKTRL